MNFLKATVTSKDESDVIISLAGDRNARMTLPVAVPVEEGAPVVLDIRPEHFAGAGMGDMDLQVTVDVADHLGNTSYVYATVAGGEQLIIERPESRSTANRDCLTIALAAKRTFLFDTARDRLR